MTPKDRDSVLAHWRGIARWVHGRSRVVPGHAPGTTAAIFAGEVRAEILADAYRGGLRWLGIHTGASLHGLRVSVVDSRIKYDISNTPLSRNQVIMTAEVS